jgi:hypothetical protein
VSDHAVDVPARRSGLGAGADVVSGAFDALVVAVWFVVAGLAGAVVWSRVVTLPQYTKTAEGATLDPEQLTQQIGIDGWFFVIALVGGLLSAVILLTWRRRDPLLMVVLVVLGGGLASWLMVRAGLALGPGKELSALRDLPTGAHVSMRLKLSAEGMVWVWSIGAALGALVQVWVLRKDDPHPGAVDTLR